MVDDRMGHEGWESSSGGMAGEHPSINPPQFLVGPSTADQFNTARLPLIPIACWRIDDIRFAFDSSFLTTDSSADSTDGPDDIRTELKHLTNLVKAHSGCPLSVFGHADPTGDDSYNKALSGRRATVIYALLIFNTDPDTAVNLWQQISNTEHWGVDQRQTMQALTGLPEGTPIRSLAHSYMQQLCPPELQLGKKDFLAQGSDSGGKGDYQGCGEFNPQLIFSQEKQNEFDEAKSINDQAGIAKRNEANTPNRRVMVLMFRKGSRVESAKWPCPRAMEGISGCSKRLWSDSETRRSTHLPGLDRKFSETNDTFGCRFYQRISTNSPCEAMLTSLIIRLFDPFTVHIAKAPYRITVGGKVFETFADSEGFVKMQVAGIPEECLVEWGHAEEEGSEAYLFSRRIYLQMKDLEEDEEMKRRLHNLGYTYENPLKESVQAFRRDYGLGDSADTKATLRQWYDDTSQIQKRPEANASRR